MDKNNINIVHMQCATIINSPARFISFDSVSGENCQPVICIVSTWLPEGFIQDLELSKIVTLNKNYLYGFSKGKYSSLSFVLTPQFGYTNQKLEDILFTLFQKYEL